MTRSTSVMMSLAHIKPSVEPQACCFASGKWFFKAEIKVAHLIPNAMTADEIFYLIGNREDMLRDPQNGIPLHSAIGTAMDLEILVVVPKEPLGSNTWQMVLVDWFFENVRGKFFQPLIPGVIRLRREMFPNGERWKRTEPKLDHSIKKVLQGAREDLRAISD